jgi:hypothetical protein
LDGDAFPEYQLALRLSHLSDSGAQFLGGWSMIGVFSAGDAYAWLGI